MALPSTNGIFIHEGYNCTPTIIPTAQSIPMSTTDNTTVNTAITSTNASNALNHLGFYLDENGGLCQVNSI